MPGFRFRPVMLVITLVLAASVCRSSSAGPAVYLPLSADNTWYYTRWMKSEPPPPGPYSLSGALSYPGTKGWSTDYYNLEYSAGVIGTEMILGASTYVWDHGTGNIYHLVNASDGIRCYLANNLPLPGVQYLLKTPVTKGAIWTFNGPIEPVFQAAVESVTDTIECKAGKFANCVRLRLTYYTGQGPLSLSTAMALGTDYDLVWYAQSIGIIREEIYRSGVLVGISTLDGFDLNYSDITPPPAPTVIDDGAISYGNSLHARLSADDPESGIAGYFVAISTTPDESGIVPDAMWDNVGAGTEFSTPGLDLSETQTYYFLVRAINCAGLESDLAVSDGIQVRLTPPNMDLVPLQINNYWGYDTTAGYYEGMPGHVSIVGSATVSTVKQFDVEIAMDMLRPTISTLGKSGLGIYRYKVNGVALSPTQLLLPVPASVGSQWQWSDAGGTNTCSVQSTTELVTVPAGAFTGCTMVRSYNSLALDKYDYVWYAPGIGVVKTVTMKLKSGVWEPIETSLLNGWRVQPGPPDTTPPSKPTASVGSAIVYGTDVTATWSSIDAESGIALYQAAVSTTITDGGIVPGTSWRSFGTAAQATLEDLPLQGGVTYYVIVRAMNAAGLWSPVGASAGFKVEKPIGSITIDPLEVTLQVKKTRQFKATVADTEGLPIIGKTVAWSVSTGGGTITTAGLLTAGAKAGNYTVSATIAGSGVTGTAAVTLIPGPASKVVVTPSPVSVLCAGTQQFSAAVNDANGNRLPDTTVTWSIPSTSKAGQIDPVTGLLTAGPTPGTYTPGVTATYGAIRGSASVKVVAPPPTTVKLFKGGVEVTSPLNLPAGSKPTFTAKGYDSLGRQISGLKFVFGAQGSAGVMNATYGTFTASKLSGATGVVTAQALIGGVAQGAVGSVEVQIVPAAPAKVIVVPATNTLAVGQTYQYQCQVLDAFNNLIPDAPVKWTMALSAAGTISLSGYFTAGSKPGSYAGAVKVVTLVGAKVGYGKVIVTAL